MTLSVIVSRFYFFQFIYIFFGDQLDTCLAMYVPKEPFFKCNPHACYNNKATWIHCSSLKRLSEIVRRNVQVMAFVLLMHFLLSLLHYYCSMHVNCI